MILERVFLVAGVLKGQSVFEIEESLQELESLVNTSGGEVIESTWQFMQVLKSSTLIGSGKLEEINARISELEIDVVVFDNSLTSTQVRNIEAVLSCTVVDRTQLILDIFALHAKTGEGKLQVEVAQLEYLLPRIMGMGKEMSKQGGGIGTRGPGETKLEVTRRRIRDRISVVKEKLKQLEKQRNTQRQRRINQKVYTVSIIGYTNSGKTTLLKALSKDEELEPKDELFATLSPVSRKVFFERGIEVVFNDTVGFIRKLPHAIVESFKATLEETIFSDIIVHVIDCADSNWGKKKRASEEVLKEINADKIPRIVVLNKIDKLGKEERELLKVSRPDCIFISATSDTKEGVEELKSKVLEMLKNKKVNSEKER